MCQRAAGGPYIVTGAVANADLTWTKGAPKTYASSTKGLRDFCGDCGTPLAFRTPGADVTDIMIVTLDDPKRVAPVRQIGMESHLAWALDLKSLPRKTTEENAGTAFLSDLVSFQDKP
jgi:hypothetical protein